MQDKRSTPQGFVLLTSTSGFHESHLVCLILKPLRQLSNLIVQIWTNLTVRQHPSDDFFSIKASFSRWRKSRENRLGECWWHGCLFESNVCDTCILQVCPQVVLAHLHSFFNIARLSCHLLSPVLHAKNSVAGRIRKDIKKARTKNLPSSNESRSVLVVIHEKKSVGLAAARDWS